MKTILTVMVMAMGLIGVETQALACGFCGGDKAASVYSFKNKKFAERVKAKYVSVELTGPQGAEEEFKRAVATLSKVKGLYPKTIRSAFAQRAVSFVFRPDSSFESLVEEFSRREPGWSMKRVEQIQ